MEIDTANLHHAYLVLGNKTDGENFLQCLLEEIGIKELGNPDFHAYRVDSFDVRTARILREQAQEKPFGEKKIFLISAERFTPEAQNALLKTLEEPRENMHFFILLREQDLLLPTLLSRLQIVRPNSKIAVDTSSPEKFLELSMRDKLNFSKEFSDSDKSLSVFLDSLLDYLRGKKTDHKILDRIFVLRRFADDPSVMSRLILEHLSFVLK